MDSKIFVNIGFPGCDAAELVEGPNPHERPADVLGIVEDGKDGESVDPNLHDAACRKITTAACREALQHSAVNAPITVIETLSAAAPRKGEDFAAITVGGVVVVWVDRSM
ncbi:hypothetical protein E4U24_003916 [Claviceps purpurea]|nr:hypothetical protein E4U28_004890 [Claviceps purpurea]KAG6246217.1 hypothetical protein E4U24_003916 [Claviceps purpurea]